MTREPFLCRHCGAAVALITGHKIRVIGVESETDLKHRTMVVVCPKCGRRRTFTPPRDIEKVTTTKAP